MRFPIRRNLLAASIFSTSLFLTGCGGGSSGGGDAVTETSQAPSNTTVADGVAGPMDTVQTQVSEGIFSELIISSSGTALATSFDCARQAIVIDLIDILDSVALALVQSAETQDTASAFEGAAANIQFSAAELAKDLPGALAAVTGADCSGASGNDGSNPFAGTALAPLGAAIAPVLVQFPGASNSAATSLNSLAQLFSQLASAFDTGLTQLPPDLVQAPIFGGILTTLGNGLSDTAQTLSYLSAYDGNATAAALETTLNNLLVNVLTNVVPVNFVEAQSSQEGTFSGPIISGVNQVTAALGSNLLAAALPQVTAAFSNELPALLSPIANTLLPALLGPVKTALASSNGADSLTLFLGPVTSALTNGGSASNPTGTVIDALLGPLVDLSGSTSCPFSGTQLAGGCTIYSGLNL